MATLIDTHCHLDFNSFDPDREAVLQHAWEAGVTRILVPGIDMPSSRKAAELAQEHPQLFAAVGVHPNDARTWHENSAKELIELANYPKIIAVGEIGLDYYRDYSPKDLQLRVFTTQLELAKELQLPVVIHNRLASHDLMQILKDWKEDLVESNSAIMDRPGVLHSFADHLDVALMAIELGFYIGFTGPITYKNAEELRRVAISVPLERILTETDAPFLAPQPKRGLRNEPAFVYYVAEKLAEIHQRSVDEIAEQIKANAETLFRW